jgi:hypothetical protein
MTQNQGKRLRQLVLDKISDRAAELLKESENPQSEMRWAETRLMEANLYNYPPHQDDPQEWAEMVIAQNLDLEDQSVPWVQEHNSHPERAETFENLILSLIPTEGSL